MAFSIKSVPPIELLRKRILGAGDKIHRKGMRLGVTAAVKPMVARMRSGLRTKEGRGALKKSIGYKTLSARSSRSRGLVTGDFGMEAGVIKAVADPGYKRQPGKVIKQDYKAFWIEYGVKPHGVKKGARRDRGRFQGGKLHPGFQERPFVRPAYNAELPFFEKRFIGEIDPFLKEI